VTVLFSDIRKFTTISEELGARETVSMLNDYFSEMVDIIFNHGGILDKYIGDAIMALFGTPFKTDEDVDNAFKVANEMMSKLRDVNSRRLAMGKDPIEIGVGVSTGEVVAGNIGSPKRMDYTVIGDSVNLASRLEGANKYYGTRILICQFTRKKLKNPELMREIDLIRVKGKTKPVAIYESLDYHTEETFPNLEMALRDFERALTYFRDRRWKDAMEIFQKVLKSNPKDGPSLLYVDRCRHYLETPPPESWDGVWTMREK
jgi:adenylate cyclase